MSESDKHQKKPTSLYVNPELWKEAKIEAIRRGITVTNLFESALKHELGRPDGSGSKGKPQRLNK